MNYSKQQQKQHQEMIKASGEMQQLISNNWQMRTSVLLLKKHIKEQADGDQEKYDALVDEFFDSMKIGLEEDYQSLVKKIDEGLKRVMADSGELDFHGYELRKKNYKELFDSILKDKMEEYRNRFEEL